MQGTGEEYHDSAWRSCRSCWWMWQQKWIQIGKLYRCCFTFWCKGWRQVCVPQLLYMRCRSFLHFGVHVSKFPHPLICTLWFLNRIVCWLISLSTLSQRTFSMWAIIKVFFIHVSVKLSVIFLKQCYVHSQHLRWRWEKDHLKGRHDLKRVTWHVYCIDI